MNIDFKRIIVLMKRTASVFIKSRRKIALLAHSPTEFGKLLDKLLDTERLIKIDGLTLDREKEKKKETGGHAERQGGGEEGKRKTAIELRERERVKFSVSL